MTTVTHPNRKCNPRTPTIDIATLTKLARDALVNTQKRRIVASRQFVKSMRKQGVELQAIGISLASAAEIERTAKPSAAIEFKTQPKLVRDEQGRNWQIFVDGDAANATADVVNAAVDIAPKRKRKRRKSNGAASLKRAA